MMVDMVIAVDLLHITLASIWMVELAGLAEPQPQRQALIVGIYQLNTILPYQSSLKASFQLALVSKCVSKPGAFNETYCHTINFENQP